MDGRGFVVHVVGRAVERARDQEVRGTIVRVERGGGLSVFGSSDSREVGGD